MYFGVDNSAEWNSSESAQAALSDAHNPARLEQRHHPSVWQGRQLVCDDLKGQWPHLRPGRQSNDLSQSKLLGDQIAQDDSFFGIGAFFDPFPCFPPKIPGLF